MFDSLSLECMPRDLSDLPEWGPLLKPGERVFVPDISGRPFGEQADAVEALAASGVRAVPHLGARNLLSKVELGERLARLTASGAKEVLLLGGESNPPKGEFDCALQILQSEEFAGCGIEAVGVAGHPEPHPAVAEEVMLEALKSKAQAIRDMELKGYIVTQLCFDADAIRAWLLRLREIGVDFPVLVGVAGPINLLRLIKVAGTLGVGKSLSFLKKRSKSMMQMLDPSYDPSSMLEEISKACASESEAISPHFYAFGNVSKSIRVLRPDACAHERVS